MKIAILTPTYQRIKKLERLITSLDSSTYSNFDHFIFCDNCDIETLDYLNKKYPERIEKTLYPRINLDQKFVIGSWNRAFEELHDKYDAFLWLVDDVEVYPNTIEEAVKAFKHAYHNSTEGVVGLAQDCPGRSDYSFKWYGQCLIGKQFVELYQDVDYQVCCPLYKHFFQDEEMWMFANNHGRFVEAPHARLKHYHPAFKAEEMDKTHNIVRGDIMNHDKLVYHNRRNKRLVWGESWDE